MEDRYYFCCTPGVVVARDVAQYDASSKEEAEYMHRRRLADRGDDGAWDVAVDVVEVDRPAEFIAWRRRQTGVPHDWTPTLYTWDPMPHPDEPDPSTPALVGAP